MNFVTAAVQADFLCRNSHVWPFLTAIASGIMAFAALFAVVSYSVSKKTQYLSTIESCSKEFRCYMRQIQRGNPPATIKRDMLGLFHKQLFYIRNHYVPVDIKIEWIKTMHQILQDNILGDEKKVDAPKAVTFGKEDWERSFDRVREFYDYQKGSEAAHPTRKQIEKKRVKHYRKTYFNCWQRFWLRWNSQWKKAFPAEIILAEIKTEPQGQ
ncbi:hypothetical protein INQ51_17460 [Maribellus sp. CM-23]|uniref:hypothetical protein n=1 Tax=Maribellus sp. CM-23 TaxID=2781026 RepID=UPI001F235457|nr:hypothetical protein [Maribellus sp. CM-23]MCE4566111.1 hypothetical protein [Maribellus sp. CM-23]